MGASFTIEFPSDPQFLCVIRSAVRHWGGVAGFSDEECRSVTLAVDEALTNIIRHAYAQRTDQRIELTCAYNDAGLEFSLLDTGRPVEASRIRGRPLDDMEPGGLGTHLIAQIMDVVEYQTLPGANRVRLVKYRAPSERGGQPRAD